MLECPVPPTPQSQFAILSLASLQKGKNPRFFEKTGMKQLQTFKLRPGFVERTIDVDQSDHVTIAPGTLFGSRKDADDEFHHLDSYDFWQNDTPDGSSDLDCEAKVCGKHLDSIPEPDKPESKSISFGFESKNSGEVE